ncbi:GAF domain-containing protein [Salibacterium salarium]|uniref:GAF domain-containing protein n=1 Tax=Salibacterium salarium TaxID=284579 RepID=A0A3R9P8W2_9BACI|nr:GAF domain-containing protein [Salibacterium salarium]RSL32933.1 GAF domain-containing protein [Salibacterium salarium]
MFQSAKYKGSLQESYQSVTNQLASLLEGEPNQIANLSNTAALLNQFLDNINWVGFYLFQPEGNELVLGPFQGLPACIRIPMGKGVCGTSALKNKTTRVGDVTQFPGHIACDAASRSEIVIPLLKNGQLIGVLDIDSPLFHRFSAEEEGYLENFVQTLQSYL